MLNIDYNYYEDNFNQTLLSELRKHGSTEEYLQLWVPDDNVVIGLAGMVDSILASGIQIFQITIAKRSISQIQAIEFSDIISRTCKCKSRENHDSYEFEFSSLGSIAKIKQTEIAKKKNKSIVEINNKSLGEAVTQKSKPVIHSDLKKAALLLDESLNHEVSSKILPNYISVSTKNYAINLKVEADGLVTDAYFSSDGERWIKNLLNLYCEFSLGVPFQEVADHNVLKIIDELKLKNNLTFSKGILLPDNCGTFFTELINACRKAYSEWMKANHLSDKVNQYILPPIEAWQKNKVTILEDMVRDCLNNYYKKKNLIYTEIISGFRLERNKSKYLIRIVIQYVVGVKIDRPSDLLAIEKYLRLHLEKTLEVVSERVSDTSPLRRLTK